MIKERYSVVGEAEETGHLAENGTEDMKKHYKKQISWNMG